MNHSSKFLMLKDFPILQSLSEYELNELAKVCIMQKVYKNKPIYGSGHEIDFVYLINKGSVKLGMIANCGKTLIKNIAVDQDLFGENIFTTNNLRQNFAEAMTDTTVFKIPVSHFRSLVESNNRFAQYVTTIIIKKLRNIEERMQNFVLLKAKARIIDFIRKTADKKGIKIGVDEILINHGLSHKEIAYLTDTSRQTVARVLGELKKDKFIHFSPRKPSKILIRQSFQFA